MNIGIDISQAVYETGVSVYTKNLVRNLLKIGGDNSFVLFGGSLRKRGELENFAGSLRGNFTTKFFPMPPTLSDILWNKLHIVNIEKLIGKVDLVHTSDWAEPPAKATKITTVHDLSPFVYPKATPKKVISAHKRKLYWVIQESKLIIAPTNATKNDLVKLGVSKESIRVIPEAAEEVFKPAKKSEIDKVKRECKINGGYLLAVGTNPRKNLGNVIAAYDKVKAGNDLKLIVVGEKPDYLEQRRGVRFVGQVGRGELRILYSGAEALVYPSLYEGFGLPILEAFACGTPVVISKTPSLMETAGKAAIKVDANDVNSIVEGVKKALRREKGLKKLGFERVKEFSWGKTAEMTLEVYKEALER